MAKAPTAPEWPELFDLLTRLERPNALHVRPLGEEERQRAIDRICEIVRGGALQGYLDERGTTREPAMNLAGESNWQLIDDALSQLRVYVPPCALDSDGRHARLELDGIPLDAVERADYLGFPR